MWCGADRAAESRCDRAARSRGRGGSLTSLRRQRMRHLFSIAVCALAMVAAPQARADYYNFQVLYSGSNTATLAAGSDDPVGLSLVDGDSFDWDIKAQG